LTALSLGSIALLHELQTGGFTKGKAVISMTPMPAIYNCLANIKAKLLDFGLKTAFKLNTVI